MKLKPKIAFIGGGNMATSLLGGLHSSSDMEPEITVSEPIEEKRIEIERKFRVETFVNNKSAKWLPSIPLIPVISAVFIFDYFYSFLAIHHPK